MKTRFLALVAILLGMVSCVQDIEPLRPSTEGEVDFQISVAASELATRAGEDGADDTQNAMDSAFGAIDYLQGAPTGDYRVDWKEVDLRYTLEVYDKADDYAGKSPVKDRQVIIKDSYEPVVFDLRLIPNRDYHFVVFADFVAEGSATLNEDEKLLVKGIRHEIGATLADITVKNEALNDEVADSYFATKDITISNSGAQNIVLKRPYGKLRVIATDLAELNLNVHPKYVSVEYELPNPNKFNAVTGNLGDGKYVANRFTTELIDNVRDNMDKHVYNVGYDAKKAVAVDGVTERNSHITLFTDYILAIPEGQTSVHFKMRVSDGSSNEIKTTEFVTEIPIERNKLTTVIGNVLTTATEIEVRVDDNFANVDDDNTTNDYDFTILETLMNGGKYTLTEDLTITEPTNLRGDAIINLNGYTLSYVASQEGNKHAIMTRVENGASLRFEGEGEVKSTGYIASANEGGKIYISEGKYTTEGCTLFQANGGEVYISGGEFQATEFNGDYRYTLNHVDSKKSVGKIEVCGGKFYKYDPSKSESENPAMNFVKVGFSSNKEGDYYVVVATQDYVDMGDHMEVYTAKGLAKWGYMVTNVDGKLDYSMKLMTNITLPQYAIVVDAVRETYVFDETQPITVTDGIPSASNWLPLCSVITEYDQTYSGHIDGQNYTISGLRISSNTNYTGLIGYMFDDASIKNLIIKDAVVYGDGAYTGAVAGIVQNGTTVENVHVKNSSISGTGNVGGVVGRNYRRVGGAAGQGYNEGVAIVKNCSSDADTHVKSSGSGIGGIVGNNYGAVIMECESYADVTGKSSVGGIVGFSRDYHHNADGYIVACTTHGEATLTATGKNGSVGGVVGETLQDSSHANTTMSVVACLSFAEVKGDNNPRLGCFVGAAGGTNVVASVALISGTSKAYGTGSLTTEEIYIYSAGQSGTQAEVDAMNGAIAAYNATAPAEAQCSRAWAVTASVPALQ